MQLKKETIFFTALNQHRDKKRPRTVQRHLTYIKALEKTGTTVVYGKYLPDPAIKCKICNHPGIYTPQQRYKEKHTDVNIAITLLERAIFEKFDVCLLFSEDNDYVPAVQRVKDLEKEGILSKKRIIICPPPKKKRKLHDLQTAAGEKFYNIKILQIENCQFDDDLGLDNAGNLIKNPWGIPSQVQTP